MEIRSRRGDDFRLASVRIGDALSMGEDDFRRATETAYETLAAEMSGQDSFALVRMWNFLPRILEPLGGHPHRYMVFNEGRWQAFVRLYGSPAEMALRVPTASGVGHHGTALVVHALGAREPGQVVENPRQLEAYRYSSRYGPRPPCFARATRLRHLAAPWLLVGGTASVVGEDAVYADDVEGQLEETIRNLESLVGENTRRPASLRVYYVRREDKGLLERRTRALFDAGDVEFVFADLCRSELLVEIEALYRNGEHDAPSA